MTTKQLEFSVKDAQNLIELAERAPLTNMTEAKHVSALLGRFTAWFNAKSAKRVRKVTEPKT